ncbi:SAM-dependent methyltransferase [Lacticaseibacillus yichunensis]|uniref:SAM-dependent methyltransferase n=1 Tax=Lacticaseibacillus yichunensis TaxID=2486015 RepID=A0ABW4CSM5_9LACO|nr:SAM-dependent methyltransferase [Lacticaseibacillus yichunensis]
MTLEDDWRAESRHAMHGWDFSHLNGRWQTDPLPWQYEALVRSNMHSTDQWLDIDTGGGELMQGFRHDPALTAVTEGWDPNIELLRQTIVPTGVTLYADSDETLAAVPTEAFDLVTDSHGALPVTNIARVMRAGALFVTQQVGGDNNYGLSRFFDEEYVPAYPQNMLLQVAAEFQAAGLQILEANSAMAKMTFADVGAIVYYATMIPWEFPQFDIERAMPKLHQLQDLLEAGMPLQTFESRFMIIATKPA